MQLKEIVDQFNSLDICEKRECSDKYGEFVFYKKDISQWQELFANLLGSPVKTAADRPTKEDECLTQEYGGIRKNQILYRKDFETYSVIAMFWPWQDDTHVTLKLACLEK